MSLKNIFDQQLPGVFFLNGNDLASLHFYLQSGNFLQENEHLLSSAKPGEGNMNYVLRINTNHRSFILKQARPWVEKYPQIAAPIERSVVEALFLQNTQEVPELSLYSPRLLWSDPENYILALEDLGEASDYSRIYQREEKISANEISRAVRYLKILHHLPLDRFPGNHAMRHLNHEHIFHFPFRKDNGLDLDAIHKGLSVVALPFKNDEALKKKIQRLGEIYLSQGRSLIHGDFYPGSWLQAKRGLMIIDPEFAFHGPPEFDLAVMFAHLLMANQGKEILKTIWSQYDAPANFDQCLLSAFTGVEIMRRIIGIAQLPLSLSIAEKVNLMANASEWIRKENLLPTFL